MAEYAGFEVILQVNAGGWVNVAQVRDITGPSVASEQIEVSHRDSVWRRYVAGMRDGGEVTFDCVFDPDHTSHDPTLSTSMYRAAEDGTVMSFRLDFPGAGSAVTRAAFSAFVSNWENTAPLEDALAANVTLKITGQVTWSHVP